MDPTSKPRLLLTGASGFLGYNILRASRNSYQILAITNQHPLHMPGLQQIRVDISKETGLRNVVRETRPDAVIHTAYISDINYCQTHPHETDKLNINAAIYLAKLAADMVIPYVFTSSDMVFDGAKGSAYVETDPVNPLNHYGLQKAKAEEGIIHTYPDAAICRMPLMYGLAGPGSKNFFVPQLHKFKSGEPVHLFTDEYRSALGGISAARALLLALRSFKGIYHLGGTERLSRYQLGLLWAAVAGIAEPNIIPTRQDDINMPAPRPKDVAMDSIKASMQGFRPLANKDEMEQILAIINQ